MIDKNGRNHIEAGTSNGGQFTSDYSNAGEKLHNEVRDWDKSKELTPEEKIASVKIDFEKDNILPKLNKKDLMKIGCEENKNVLLKKNIIDINTLKHNDLTKEESEFVIAQALYSEKKEIIPSKHKEKPNYFTFAQVVRVSKKDGSDIYGAVLLDVDKRKECFEVVHWHFVRYDKLKSLK